MDSSIHGRQASPKVMRMTGSASRILGSVLVLTVVLTVSADRGSAAEAVTFEGVASSYGVDFTLSNPSIPVGLVIQGAGPVAQAVLSPIRSDGFASMPYPGDVAANINGALGSLLLNGMPLPPYPFYTASSLGSPHASANFPGITLASESGPDRTTSSAVAGMPAVGFESKADVRATGEGAGVATATTKFTALGLSGILDISGVISSATVELQPDGSLERSTSLSIGRISVPGLAIRLPETTPSAAPVPVPIPGAPQVGSVPLPPIPLPLGGTLVEAPDLGFVDGNFTITLPGLGPPQKFAIPAQPVLDAFAATGVVMKYQPAIKTPTGVIASSLSISTVLPAPPANDYVNGETPITVAVGRASASISAGGDTSGSDDFDTSGSVDLAAGATSAPTFGTPGIPALAPTIAAHARPISTVPGGSLVNAVDLGSAESFYLVFVAIGLGCLLMGQVLRLLGVRT